MNHRGEWKILENQKEKKSLTVSSTDIKIAVAIIICCLSDILLKALLSTDNVGFLQKMTACIACILCCQEEVETSWTFGINRLIITAIGSAVGLLAICLDECIGNEFAMVLILGIGVLCVLCLCKAAKVAYINARIGVIVFILVTCTLTGDARINYTIIRFVSTIYGALVSLFVTWVVNKLARTSKLR